MYKDKMTSFYSLAGAALAFILVYTAYSLWQNLLHRQRARQYGCKPAYLRPYHLPFGIDIMKRYMDQMEQNNSQADDLVVYQELGARPTWHQNVLGYWHHVTADPKNIQAMLATQFKDFSLGPLRRGSFEPLIGHGIFTSDGKDWERSRALLRPQFARGQIADLKLEETHVQHLLKRLVVDEADGWTARMDLVPLFFNLTLDSATEFFFGHSALSQTISPQEEGAGKDVKPLASIETRATDSDWARLGKSFDAANAAVLYRSRLMDLYFLYNPQSFQKDCRHVHKCVDQVVDRALARYESSKNDHSDVHGQGYLFIDELTKATQNRKELRSQLLNVLLAGRDTTAGLLGWTFYYLARHPAVYGKLREAVLDDFGPDTSLLTFESLKSCTYLQYVMLEILRLEPVVPENSRRAVRNTTLPRGGGPDGQAPIYIRAGEEVVYNVTIMHRRKDIWGEDADEFQPERWHGRKYSWEYLPFNGGPRICLGQQFALTEAGYVIARIVQKFDAMDNLDSASFTRRRFTATTSPLEVLVRLHKAPQ